MYLYVGSYFLRLFLDTYLATNYASNLDGACPFPLSIFPLGVSTIMSVYFESRCVSLSHTFVF